MTDVPTDQQYWTIPRMWEGESVVIIGGGLSLEGFDWVPFHRWNVIGCNDAYLLGDWVDVVHSGDRQWLEAHCERSEYVNFKGLKITVAPGGCPPEDRHRTKPIKRKLKGMSDRQDELGWNDSTGASAICLAVKFGCARIYLLGFDMKMGHDGQNYRNNWHENNLDQPDPDVYPRHISACIRVAQYVERVHPNVKIFNAGPDSVLDVWLRIEVNTMLHVEQRLMMLHDDARERRCSAGEGPKGAEPGMSCGCREEVASVEDSR